MKKYQKLEIGNFFRFWNSLCPSTYDLSIVVKCEKSVFKMLIFVNKLLSFKALSTIIYNYRDNL